MSTRAMVAAVALATATACAGEERLAPAPTGGGEGGAPTSSATTGAGTSTATTGAGTPVREVLVRNPMGDQAGNLLADGDFELSITSNPGQQGWNYYGFQGAAPLQAETGGLCRSGLRCAILPRSGVLFGRGTAAADRAPMQGEVWLRPLEGASCDQVSVFALSCDAFGPLGVSSVVTEEDGWCVRRWLIAPSSTAACLYIENESQGAVLVDHASVRVREGEDDGTTARALTTVPPATRARMDRLRDHLRRTIPLGAPAHDVELDPTP